MLLALPNSKRLLPPVLEWFAERGFDFRPPSDRVLRWDVPNTDIHIGLFKPRVIPEILALGMFDVGVTGLDSMFDADIETPQHCIDMKLNPVNLMVAVPQSKSGILENLPRRPLVVGTEYPNIAEKWLLNRGLSFVTLLTGGSTEAFLPDICDIIIDVVETGETLKKNGLVSIDTVFHSSTHIFSNKPITFVKG